MATPVGALPIQPTENVTEELNPSSEFTRTLVPALSPGIVDTVFVVEVMEKS